MSATGGGAGTPFHGFRNEKGRFTPKSAKITSIGRKKNCTTCHLLAPYHYEKPRIDYIAADDGTGQCIAIYGHTVYDRKNCPPEKKGFFSRRHGRKTRRVRRH